MMFNIILSISTLKIILVMRVSFHFLNKLCWCTHILDTYLKFMLSYFLKKVYSITAARLINYKKDLNMQCVM